MNITLQDSQAVETTAAWSSLYGSPHLLDALHREIFRASAPLVITGDSVEVLATFIQTKLEPHLRSKQSDGAVVMFTPKDQSGILSSLSQALTSMFRGLTLELLHSVRTQQWAPLLRSLVRNEPAPGGQRILVVADFDSVFNAPIGEQELFTEAIGMIAREKGITVIIGACEKNLGRVAQLPGMPNVRLDGGCLHLSKSEWIGRRNAVQRAQKSAEDWWKSLRAKVLAMPEKMKAISPLKWATGAAIVIFAGLVLTAVSIFIAQLTSEKPILTESLPLVPAKVDDEPAPNLASLLESKPKPAQEESADDGFEPMEVIETGSEKIVPRGDLIPASRDSAKKDKN